MTASTSTTGDIKKADFRIQRRYTKEGVHPFDLVAWESREATILNAKGKVIFSQKGIEIPSSWSQSATNIVASKYFRGKLGTSDREYSVKQMITRVVKTISDWGRNGGYFTSPEEIAAFESELSYLLVNQMAAFNSPVWFNVGIEKRPQCSACFINSVDDDMRSILNLAVTEGMLFKYGSGTGSNLSCLRSSREHLSTGGMASGQVSFMKGFDAFAGVIKSGGRTRRAAKMVILNVEHPDIRDFVWCKAKEEKKAKDLIALGYDGSLDGEVYENIFFQNANNSVRVSDEFMQAAAADKEWQTKNVTDGTVIETLKARNLLGEISQATWECGDPGLQFDTTINKWHTCKNSDRINASNPCSEFMFVDDSACNLASVNLLKFYDASTGKFDLDGYKHAVSILIFAQEIIVGSSSYPTAAIERNSLDFRPLGLGYANLGALLMANGLAYDSDEGRNYAAALSSVMTGYGYYISAALAKRVGPFHHFPVNRDTFREVIVMHLDCSKKIDAKGVPANLHKGAVDCWNMAFAEGVANDFRNAQVTCIAPTGTIGFMMDCDTTGIEPDMALVKYKWLVGGGNMKIVNGTIKMALVKLGYTEQQIVDIASYIEATDMIEGAPHLKDEHLPVFDCAFKPANGYRCIHHMGHVRMMAAVQPFVSGAISKTVNMPKEATTEEIFDVYKQSWEMGLKAIAIYRDGSKGTQPVTVTKKVKEVDSIGTEATKELTREIVREVIVQQPVRVKLADERKAITHKFSISGHEGYLTVGLYDSGQPGEIFITMSKEGSSVSGMMDAFSTSISIALQYGVPLKTLVKKFTHMRFEPSGFTSHPNIRFAKSMMDYIFRWMALKFLSREEQLEVGVNLDFEEATISDDEEKVAGAETASVTPIPVATNAPAPVATNSVPTVGGFSGSTPPGTGTSSSGRTTTPIIAKATAKNSRVSFQNSEDAPACHACGSIMVRNGACYKCLNCGGTSGCS
ncbi:Vitamin B12-dependent ribonucleoside-diphosphate reductase [uncultured archaeon]|nr:Vitamin B12-dependent ribonucleoside-diphosphate reductase [uncultured archaeon]